MDWVSSILQIVKNLIEIFNRETDSDEKIKDTSIKTTRDYKRAVSFARQIFDGKRNFQGLDMLLKDKLEEKDYKEYIRLRKKFNHYS